MIATRWCRALPLFVLGCASGPSDVGHENGLAAAGQGGMQAAVSGASASGGNGLGGRGIDNPDPTDLPIVNHEDASVDSSFEQDPDQPPREDCGKLVAIVRDFKREHPDFERNTIEANIMTGERNLVEPTLELGFPKYAHPGPSPGGEASGPLEFYEWYVDAPP